LAFLILKRSSVNPREAYFKAHLQQQIIQDSSQSGKCVKDKELTKQKLIRAVGEVVKKEGFQNLKISKIAKYAQVDRKLI
jgi:hypothetical protein